jgi:hypothetical protein
MWLAELELSGIAIIYGPSLTDLQEKKGAKHSRKTGVGLALGIPCHRENPDRSREKSGS